jgi:hypothetical protein
MFSLWRCSILLSSTSVRSGDQGVCISLLLVSFILLWFHHNFIRDKTLHLLSFKEKDCVDLQIQCEKLGQQFSGFRKRAYPKKESEESLAEKLDLYAESDPRSLSDATPANRKKNYKGSLQQWWLFALIVAYWILDSIILVYQMNFHAMKVVQIQTSNGIIVKKAWEDNQSVVNEVAKIKLYLLNHLHGSNYTYNNASLISSLNGDRSQQHFDFTKVASLLPSL